MRRAIRIRNPNALAELEAKLDRGPLSVVVPRVRKSAALLAAATIRREAFERKLEFDMRCVGLPAPVLQLAFISGRKFTADFAWPAHSLVVEVQGGIWRRGGGAHSGGVAIERDIEKQQLALLNGWQIFPVTTSQVTSGEAVQLIELALRRRGWKP